MNSTAVIIGAMLISPLLGPVIGIGFGVGIYDFDLIKKSYKNFVIAVVISVLASTLYFLITPISDAQSELLARTTPTIYDVFIAFFGGLAGVVANTRKDKFGTVIPGVAIATALMPPLCTAGFGLATGNLYYFFGAFYLFFINSVFISLATFLVVRFLKFPIKEFVDKARERKVHRYIWILVILTLTPSIYLGYGIVSRSVFERNTNAFITNELNFPKTYIMSKHLEFGGKENLLRVIVLGEFVEEDLIAFAEGKLDNYGLQNTRLEIQQGINAKENAVDLNYLKTSVLEDFYKNAEGQLKTQEEKIKFLERELGTYKQSLSATKEMKEELMALDDGIKEFSINRSILAQTNVSEMDTVFLVYLHYKEGRAPLNKTKLDRWLRARLKSDDVRLIYNQ
jgi:uncharacterized hydrophobic protein (TIGR00271 family)